MTISEIISLEKSKKPDEILLHLEGIFLRAYEQSAWLFYHCIKQFEVKKKFVKAAGSDIVYLGFPESSVQKPEPYGDYDKTFVLKVENFAGLPDFESWKEGIEATSMPAVEPAAQDIYKVLADKIISFPIESKTPVECMLFLAEIKKEWHTQKN